MTPNDNEGPGYWKYHRAPCIPEKMQKLDINDYVAMAHRKHAKWLDEIETSPTRTAQLLSMINVRTVIESATHFRTIVKPQATKVQLHRLETCKVK